MAGFSLTWCVEMGVALCMLALAGALLLEWSAPMWMIRSVDGRVLSLNCELDAQCGGVRLSSAYSPDQRRFVPVIMVSRRPVKGRGNAGGDLSASCARLMPVYDRLQQERGFPFAPFVRAARCEVR